MLLQKQPASGTYAKTDSARSSSEDMQKLCDAFRNHLVSSGSSTASQSSANSSNPVSPCPEPALHLKKGDHVYWQEAPDVIFVGEINNDINQQMLDPDLVLVRVHRHMTDDKGQYGELPAKKTASAVSRFPFAEHISPIDTLRACSSLKSAASSASFEGLSSCVRDLVREITLANIHLEMNMESLEAQLKRLWESFFLPRREYNTAKYRLVDAFNMENGKRGAIHLLELFGNRACEELDSVINNPRYLAGKQISTATICLGLGGAVLTAATLASCYFGWLGDSQRGLSKLVSGVALEATGLKQGSIMVEVKGPLEGFLELHARLQEHTQASVYLSGLGNLQIIGAQLNSISTTTTPRKTVEVPFELRNFDAVLPSLMEAICTSGTSPGMFVPTFPIRLSVFM